MGMAMDTVGFYRTAGGSADTDFEAVTMNSGDSPTIRSFPNTATAKLENIFMGVYSGNAGFSIRSPMFHDNVKGITLTPGESPTQYALPSMVGQNLISQDTLSIRSKVLTASISAVGALSIFYSNLLGTSARLHSWGDISGDIKSIKPMEVEIAPGAPSTGWFDRLITHTEDLLHANKDYAVLGYVTEFPAVCIGIKGTETGNLRICGPGTTRTIDTSDYFVKISERQGVPHIPVINSANKDSLYATVLGAGLDTALDFPVQYILAELDTNLSD